MTHVPAQASHRAFWRIVTGHPIVEPDDLAKKDSLGVSLGARFRGTDASDVARRLSIYSHGYLMRIVGVLERQFEVTSQLMGDEAFPECVWRYLRRHPSRNANLRWVGRHFADYLDGATARQTHPLCQRRWFVELARLEWARDWAFDAPQASVIGFDQLTKTPPECWAGVELSTVGSLGRVESRFDAASLLRRVKSGQPPTMDEPPSVRHHVLVVWRRGADVVHLRIGEPEARALQLLETTPHLGAFCGRFAELEELDERGAAERALSHLKDWTERGWLSQG